MLPPLMFDTCRSASLLLLDTFAEERFEPALDAMRARLGGPADLVIAFVSTDHLPHLPLFLELVQIGLRCPKVVGATAAGLVGDDREHEGVAGCSLLALRLPGSRVSIESWPEDPTHDPAGNVPDAGAGALLLANPVTLAVDPFLARWNARHPRLPAFGGFASGGTTPETITLFTQDGPSPAACLAVHFTGGVTLDGALGQACRPIGEPAVITGCHGNVITSLADHSPIQRLEEALNAYAARENLPADIGPGMIHAGLTIAPDGLAPSSPLDDVVIRAIIGGDPDTGAIAIAGTPRLGQMLRFHLRDAESADVWWRQSLAMARDRHPALPVAALLFPCLGRGAEFFGHPDHDASLIHHLLGNIPIAGCFANGELASHPVALQAHTFSTVALFFYPTTTQTG